MSDRPTAQRTGLEIAVIGMAGRFPGARSVAGLWRNLCDGVEAISFFSDAELAPVAGPAVLRDPRYVKARGVVEDADLFDAEFFGYSPREAEIMDPQQRLFLECAWEALEEAGYDPFRLDAPVGVYGGMALSTYSFNLLSHPDLMGLLGGQQVAMGNDKDYLCTRVAYKLGLEGPSVAVQTACSTSLVAVHLACQALLSGECDMALAGGVSIAFPQQAGYWYQEGGILSPDGHCRAFDARARGTVGGGGFGIVVLKRLADALADGDAIRAVIVGSAVNNDGAHKAGYTAPRIEGQARVIRAAQLMAEVDPDTIGYLEAHGTGTELGDPIEIAALSQVFGGRAPHCGPCAIGSIKTNIGHLNTAAGIAGLIKAVLAVEKGLLPPSLHFEEPNPRIDFAGGLLAVNRELRPWPANGAPRRAGVSSFGIGGTNAHAVLEEAPPAEPGSPSRAHQLLVLSARSAPALGRAARNLATHLAEHPDLDLADVAHTLQVGRAAFETRWAVVADSRESAIEALAAPAAARIPEARPRVAFLFPGQGAQHVGMGRDLYAKEPTFRAELDRCCDLLRPHLGLDLRELLTPEAGRSAEARARLDRTEVTQPALFSLEYALARQWMEWGIAPEWMLGHSVGEYVAACLAGVFSLEDALAVVSARGRLMQGLPPGAMLSVHLPAVEAGERLCDGLWLASVNGPDDCVIAGFPAAVEALAGRLDAQGVRCSSLRTSHAFHSGMMDPILPRFAAELARIPLAEPRIPYVSNLTGTWISAAEATDVDYWVQHLRQPVRLAAGLETLLAQGDPVLLEVGPGRGMSSLVRRQPAGRGRPVIESMRHPEMEGCDQAFLLQALGRLWTAGGEVDWQGFSRHERRRRVALPSYPFERRRYWLDRDPAQAAPARGAGPADWLYVPVWREVPVDGHGDPETPGSWLILADQGGFGERLAARLAARGHRVVTVLAGSALARLGAGSYTLDPAAGASYVDLLRELAADPPGRIVHLWTLDEAAGASLERLEASQTAAFWSLLFLAQALGSVRSAPEVELTVVSQGLHGVTGDEALRPEIATLLGPVRVIPQEHPGARARSVDVVLPAPGGEGEERLLRQLLSELLLPPEEPVVAWRGLRRWVPRCDRPAVAAPTSRPARLREHGVYLITGGLGGVGLELARYLASAVQAKLVLLGRTGLPPRETWDAPGAGPFSPTVERRVQAVRHLESLGAEVLVLAADVTAEESLRCALDEARRRFGPIQGAIHAAGVPGGGLIAVKEREAAAAVLAPKLRGTVLLDALLAGEPLDFFVLCSSLTAVLGGIGQVDYTAANAFLDAFAWSRAARGDGAVQAIDWDVWREVGMAVDAELPPDLAALREASLAGGMPSSEAVEVFGLALAMARPQCAVSTVDLPARAERLRARREGGARGLPEARREAGPAHARPDLEQAYVEPRNETEAVVAGIFRDVLGLDRVGADDDFFALGGHSLLGLQVISRLQEAFAVEVTVRLLFEAPTVARLAAVVAGAQGDRAAPVEPLSGPAGAGPVRERVDELSDLEVDALLARLLVESEGVEA